EPSWHNNWIVSFYLIHSPQILNQPRNRQQFLVALWLPGDSNTPQMYPLGLTSLMKFHDFGHHTLQVQYSDRIAASALLAASKAVREKRCPLSGGRQRECAGRLRHRQLRIDH